MTTRSRARSETPSGSRFARREPGELKNPSPYRKSIPGQKSEDCGARKSRRKHDKPEDPCGARPESRTDAAPPGLNPGLSATLSEEEVHQLWMLYKHRGSASAREKLIVHYMHTLVRRLASRLRASLPQQVELEDLMQEGYQGLADTLERFDLGRNIRFETFGSQRIDGAMRDYLRKLDPASRLARTRSKSIQSAVDRFLTQHGRPPEPQELRAALNLSPAKFSRVLADRHPAAILPFNTLGSDQDDSDDAMAAFEDQQTPNPLSRTAHRDLCVWLTRGLDRRDRLIVILYYYETLTMKEVGGVIGCSESRVSQRLESILDRLRAKLHNTETERDYRR